MSLMFQPKDMGGADGTIRLLGYKLQERRDQFAAEIPRPRELSQPQVSFEIMSVISTATTLHVKSFSFFLCFVFVL